MATRVGTLGFDFVGTLNVRFFVSQMIHSKCSVNSFTVYCRQFFDQARLHHSQPKPLMHSVMFVFSVSYFAVFEVICFNNFLIFLGLSFTHQSELYMQIKYDASMSSLVALSKCFYFASSSFSCLAFVWSLRPSLFCSLVAGVSLMATSTVASRKTSSN